MANTVVRRICARSTASLRSLYNLSYTVRSRTFNEISLGWPGRPPVYPRLLQKNVVPYGCVYNVSSNYSQGVGKTPEINEDDSRKKLSLFKRFKQMYRDYWYVLVPVHVITSAGWFGTFYYMAKSGIDIVALLESWHVSNIIINPLRDSSMGYVAVAYALYKIATPIRYMVTLGGTTISIKYLKEWGYIKPVPSTQQLKDMYLEKKEHILEKVRGRRANLRWRTNQMKKKQNKLMGGLEKSLKTKIADTKQHLKGKKDDVLGELRKPLKMEKRKDQ